MKRPVPPLSLRLAVLLGAMAALLGTVGFLWLPSGSDGGRVRVLGPIEEGGLELYLEWQEPPLTFREPLDPTEGAGVWRLPAELPSGAEVIAVDPRVRPPRVLARSPVVASEGCHVLRLPDSR